jgi:hypothetical protein
METQAYVYNGDWVADCPREGCSGAEFLFDVVHAGYPAGPGNPRTVRKAAFTCSNCLAIALIGWPDEATMAQVMEVLALRPVPTTRNWYPKDHPGAVRFRIPHGQSVAELREENAAHGIAVHAA